MPQKGGEDKGLGSPLLANDPESSGVSTPGRCWQSLLPAKDLLSWMREVVLPIAVMMLGVSVSCAALWVSVQQAMDRS